MSDDLSEIIQRDIEENLSKRGYGEQQFGGIDMKSDWVMLAIVAIALYLVFS